MIKAELRYVGWIVALIGAFVAAVLLAISIVTWTHMGPLAGTLLTFAILGAFGYLYLTFWLRSVRARVQKGVELVPPAPPARYAPTVIGFGFYAVAMYFIVTDMVRLNANHWQHGVDSFVLLCAVTVLATLGNLREWRSFFRPKPPAPPSERERRRLEQFTETLALPKTDSRRRALLKRGYFRLAFVGAAIVLPVCLFATLGGTAALLGIVAIAGLFLLLHWRFGL